MAVKKSHVDERPLLETHPHLKEFLAYLPEANKESARGEVLISLSYLDELLRRVIVAFFIDHKAHAELVDDANGPVNTLSARIKLCAALGLLNKREADEMHRLRKIRNRFSHEVHVSFDDQQIKALCANLTYKAPDYDQVVVNPRGQFSTAATALMMNLVNRAHYVGLERRQEKDWRY